jgi:hypothetical protein
MEVSTVASTRRIQAAKRNIRKPQQAARRKRTIARLPKSTRSKLGKQAARGRQRGGRAGHVLEHIKEQAKKEDRYRGRDKEVAARTVTQQHEEKGHREGVGGELHG